MGFDIRFPLGLLFVIIGTLLAVFGALGDKAIYARSLGINVNLRWGLVILLVGGVFLRFALRHRTASGELDR